MTDWAFVAEETEGTEPVRGVAALFPYRRYGRKRPGTGKNLCETRKWNTQFHRKFSNGKTGLPFQKFDFFRTFSSGTNRKIMLHLKSNCNFRNLLVNGKSPVWPIFPNVTNFLQCDPFSAVWSIYLNVTHLSQCDTLFTVRHIFPMWEVFSQRDPFSLVWPIFPHVTQPSQCDPF